MKAKGAISITTLYLVAYVILFNTGLSVTALSYLFLTSPAVLIWMVYTVLKDDSHYYPDLDSGKEWGYKDKMEKNVG